MEMRKKRQMCRRSGESGMYDVAHEKEVAEVVGSDHLRAKTFSTCWNVQRLTMDNER